MRKNDTQTVPSIDANVKTVRRVLQLCTVIFILSSLFFLGFKRTDWFPWVGGCYPVTQENHFLAYCHSVRYGDYEHYAYYHESEPEAVANVKRADVIFLGSSNTQFAFSTSAVSDYFDEQSVSHYVLGFGHGAQSGVAEAVASKLALHPGLWVVNADPFFTGEVNATFERIHQPDSHSFLPTWLQTNIHGEHSRKRWLQVEQRRRCDSADGSDLWCKGAADTLHRNASNGHWLVENYRENLERPTGIDNVSHVEKISDYTRHAQRFMQALEIDASCLVITASPRTDTPETYAKQLAENLGSPFVAPTIDGLKTIDDYHLDPDSAQRWSAAFLEELSPHLRRCVPAKN